MVLCTIHPSLKTNSYTPADPIARNPAIANYTEVFLSKVLSLKSFVINFSMLDIPTGLQHQITFCQMSRMSLDLTIPVWSQNN